MNNRNEAGQLDLYKALEAQQRLNAVEDESGVPTAGHNDDPVNSRNDIENLDLYKG
jgi:hypothetical protein